MNYSIWIVTATCVAGANPNPSHTHSHTQPCSAQVIYQGTTPYPDGDAGVQRPGPFQRLKSWLSERMQRPGCDHSYTHVMAAYVEPPVAAAPEVQLTAASQPFPELRKDLRGKCGAAPDYSSITGRLSYVHTQGGLWVLRYAPIDHEDRFGGSVVLASAVSMKKYREGDLVTVEGEVLNEGRATKELGGALYRARSIQMLERAD